MVQTITSWKTILSRVMRDYPDLSPRSYKFKTLAALIAEEHDVSSSQATELALNLGLKWYPRPKNLPESWKLILCKLYLSQRYLNPNDPMEFVVVKPPNAFGGLPHLLHRTSQGFVDASWFYEVVPQLERFMKDPAIGRVFSEKFNENVNKRLEKERQGQGMTMGQIQTINLFFNKFVPGLECICPTCFKVSLPRSGAGERWTHRSNEDYEIRLSARKPEGQEGQQVEYVSHREFDQNKKKLIYATWNKNQKMQGFSDEMAQKDTHIPWEIYDFNKFTFGMPLCNCKNKKY